jgi:hypothetical protein
MRPRLTPPTVGDVDGRTAATRARTSATRWSVAVLALATILLALALAASAAYVLMFARALGADVGPADLAPDAAAVVAEVLPGVAAAWLVGLLAARGLSGRSPRWPWAAGLGAGLLGCLVGALVLYLAGAL